MVQNFLGQQTLFIQNSKPAGVLLSAVDYNDLVYRKSFLDSVESGIDDVESGRTVTTDELRRSLQARRSVGYWTHGGGY